MSDQYGFCQLLVYAVTGILDGNYAVFLFSGDHGDRLAAIASEGEEKSFKLLVICCNITDYIDLAFFG